jgi:ribosomal protein S25
LETDIARRGTSDDEIVLGVLDAIERDRNVTQRHVASELGIALGLANAYLKRCVRKGLIKVSHVPTRRYAYYLTPQGFAEKSRLTGSYLAHSFAFFRKARSECDAIFTAALSKGQRRLVLVGKGELAEIASLVAREHPIEIVAIVERCADAGVLARSVENLGAVDGVVITTLDDPRGTFDAAITAFGAERVHAPKLLRLHQMPQAARLDGMSES